MIYGCLQPRELFLIMHVHVHIYTSCHGGPDKPAIPGHVHVYSVKKAIVQWSVKHMSCKKVEVTLLKVVG